MNIYKEAQQANSKPMIIIKNRENGKEKKEKSNYKVGYSLIDPSNFSPPNLFLETLKKRITIYEDFSKKVERREIE